MWEKQPIATGRTSRVLSVSSTWTLSPTVGRVSGESGVGGPAEGREECEEVEEEEEWGDWSSILVEQSGGAMLSVEEEGSGCGGGAGGKA